MATKELRFALDEKGLKNLVPTLVGQTMTYWDSARQLSRGRVTNAEVKRDRYGNPFIEVELAELGGPDTERTVTAEREGEVPDTAPGGGEGAAATEASPGRPGGRPS